MSSPFHAHADRVKRAKSPAADKAAGRQPAHQHDERESSPETQKRAPKRRKSSKSAGS